MITAEEIRSQMSTVSERTIVDVEQKIKDRARAGHRSLEYYEGMENVLARGALVSTLKTQGFGVDIKNYQGDPRDPRDVPRTYIVIGW